MSLSLCNSSAFNPQTVDNENIDFFLILGFGKHATKKVISLTETYQNLFTLFQKLFCRMQKGKRVRAPRWLRSHKIETPGLAYLSRTMSNHTMHLLQNIWIWDQSISVRAKLACICHLFKTLSALWNDDKGGLEGLNCWNTISSLSKLLSAELMEDNSTNPTLNLYFGRRQNWVFGAKKKKSWIKELREKFVSGLQ